MFVQMKQRQEAGETSKKPFDMQLEWFPTEVLKYELKENIYFVSDSKIVFLVFFYGLQDQYAKNKSVFIKLH